MIPQHELDEHNRIEDAKRSASEAFERDAARFYAETGMMAPGKDEAVASLSSYEERQRAWHAWCLREAERRTDDEAPT